MKPASIVNFKKFEWAIFPALIKSTIFFAGAVFEHMISFRNCFICGLPVLKYRQKFVVPNAYTKLTSNEQSAIDVAFAAENLVETSSLIAAYEK